MKVSIIGEKALMQRMSTLAKQSEANRIARPAVREAASKIVKAAKANVIEETGLLKESIGLRAKTTRGVVYAVVGPRRKKFKRVVFRTLPSGYERVEEANPTKYAHLIEFGTKHAPPHPFMRPAFDSVDSRGIMQRRMWHELRKAAQGRTGKSFADKAAVAALKRAGR